MLSPHTKAGALPFSRSLREGGASSLHRGGGPPDPRQAAHDDALSSAIPILEPGPSASPLFILTAAVPLR
jgi:hypothetical protein